MAYAVHEKFVKSLKIFCSWRSYLLEASKACCYVKNYCRTKSAGNRNNGSGQVSMTEPGWGRLKLEKSLSSVKTKIDQRGHTPTQCSGEIINNCRSIGKIFFKQISRVFHWSEFWHLRRKPAVIFFKMATYVLKFLWWCHEPHN